MAVEEPMLLWVEDGLGNLVSFWVTSDFLRHAERVELDCGSMNDLSCDLVHLYNDLVPCLHGYNVTYGRAIVCHNGVCLVNSHGNDYVWVTGIDDPYDLVAKKASVGLVKWNDVYVAADFQRASGVDSIVLNVHHALRNYSLFLKQASLEGHSSILKCINVKQRIKN